MTLVKTFASLLFCFLCLATILDALFFISCVSRRRKILAVTSLNYKSSVKIRRYELKFILVNSEISSIVKRRLSLIFGRIFQFFCRFETKRSQKEHGIQHLSHHLWSFLITQKLVCLLYHPGCCILLQRLLKNLVNFWSRISKLEAKFHIQYVFLIVHNNFSDEKRSQLQKVTLLWNENVTWVTDSGCSLLDPPSRIDLYYIITPSLALLTFYGEERDSPSYMS